MENYADRLVEAIKEKGNPCVVGLDPRIDQMPGFIVARLARNIGVEVVREAITYFHRLILDSVALIVPAVKPQIAFYEQYGLGGIMAFIDTIKMAKERGLIVIVDAKCNDIPSTAEAYANAFLGRTRLPYGDQSIFDVDCITVSPFRGRDSLEPFVEACKSYGKGIFVLVKTSNPGSADVQDVRDSDSGEPVYLRLARMVNEMAEQAVGKSGYSSIGAVVGATFPRWAKELRSLMPRSIFLVPGYGAQSGTAEDAANCFNQDGLGAVVAASRSITYAFDRPNISEDDYARLVRQKAEAMAKGIMGAIRCQIGVP